MSMTSIFSCESRSVTSELDSFLGASVESEGTLRENVSALTVMENLEQFWFWDNVLSLGVRPILAASAAASMASVCVGSCSSLESSPFRSIEMVVTPKKERSKDGDAELGKPFLERTRSAMEERQGIEVEQDIKSRKLSRSFSDMPVDLCRNGTGETMMGICEELNTSVVYSTDEKSNSSTGHVGDNDSGREFRDIKTPFPSAKATQNLPIIQRLPKLETIPSDKQFRECKVPDLGTRQTSMRRRERRRATKSMTDLEFDEVKGFMDLGFKFNMDDLSPHVVTMLPGLQRLGGQGKTQTPAQAQAPVSRPYLSEAWLIRRSNSPLLNFRMPSLREEGVDMKKQLKFWARAVASTIEQES